MLESLGKHNSFVLFLLDISIIASVFVVGELLITHGPAMASWIKAQVATFDISVGLMIEDVVVVEKIIATEAAKKGVKVAGGFALGVAGACLTLGLFLIDQCRNEQKQILKNQKKAEERDKQILKNQKELIEGQKRTSEERKRANERLDRIEERECKERCG